METIASLVNRCIYEIATGTWSPGWKLPSVREAERQWGLDRRAVMKAYQRLEELGLVRGVDRSGYYVASAEDLGRVSRHRYELEGLYERMAEQIARETGLSRPGVFRYFAHLAEMRARQQPDCAFVECTATQARGHAGELTRRLDVPCLALTTQAIEGHRRRIPSHVRTLLVTGFHYGELKGLADDGLRVVSVPIEVAPTLADQMGESRGEVVIIELDETEARHIQRDLHKLDQSLNSRIEVTEDIEGALEAMFSDGDSDVSGLAMLSPRVWGVVEERWHKHRGVALIEFSIVEDAWPGIADAIGLPLGDVR